MSRIREAHEHGVALIIVLLVMMTLSALGMALALLTSTESRVTAVYRDGLAALYGADAAVEWVLSDLNREPDIDNILGGLTVSSFTDGAPGPRVLPDGTSIDLHTLTGMVSCGRAACSDADLDEESDERPWGPNNPRWRLYAHGDVGSMLPGEARGPRMYQVVWVADDPSETDGDPMRDGGGAEGGENPGRGLISLLAHGYGPTGTRRIIEATVALDGEGARFVSWREVR